MSLIVLDESGAPVMLAEVPSAGVSTLRKTGKQGGNPRHDVRSGKFAPGAGGGKPRSLPPNVSRADYNRMFDAVRDAARAYPGELDESNITSFIQKRAKTPGSVNIQQFMQMVQQQQMADLLDLLSSDARALSGFKVKAPRGYVEKVLAGLTDDDVSEIVERLEARGIKDAGIRVGKKLPKERKADVEARIAARKVEMSDDHYFWDLADVFEGSEDGEFPED